MNSDVMDAAVEIKSLRKCRGGLRSRLSILQRELRDLLAEEGKRLEVEEIQGAIADYVVRIRAVQESIEAVVDPGDDLEQEIQEAMALEASVRATQVEIKKYLARPSAEELDSSGKSSTNASLIADAGRPVLPKWELPQFDGNVLDFPAFWDQFEAAVHSRDDVSDVTRFVYLRAALAGNALKAISGYSVTAANYPLVIQVLKNRFGKPRVIVERHILALVQMERCESATTHHLRKLHDAFVQHVRALAALKKDPLTGQLSAAEVLMTICKQKLPVSLRKRWESKLAEHGEKEDDLNSLLQYIESCLEVEESVTEGNRREHGREKNDSCRKERLTTTSALQSSIVNDQGCALCRGRHKVAECADFMAMNTKARWRFARASRLCFVCLHTGHSATTCKARASGNQCHKLLLWKALSSRERDKHKSQSEDPSKVGVASASCNAPIGLQVVLARAHGPSGLSCRVTCLLDVGSQRTFIRKDLADRLGLTGPQESVIITTIGDRSSRCKVRRAEMWLSPLASEVDCSVEPVRVEGLCLPTICSTVSANPPLRKEWVHLRHLNLADQFPRAQAEVDVLIGLDHYYEFVGPEHRRGRKNEPIAIQSVFGWIVCGKMHNANNHAAVLLHVAVEEPVDTLLKKFWQLDAIGVAENVDSSGSSAELINNFEKSVSFNGERYSVKLPWKVTADLPNNFEYARKRLEQTEKRLRNSSREAPLYLSAMREYIVNDWVEVATRRSAIEGREWYLPHHAVIREDKETTRCRIVFDGSACSHGVSLNSYLEAGPALQTDLAGILIRFRRFQIGLQADVEKMFMQIGLDEGDRDVVRFLWRETFARDW
uniref:DUF1758 domain-containing protein n=1 Tax=Trichuris muris TaxID=70415 RepID=A0A5S6QJA6_TRIMR